MSFRLPFNMGCASIRRVEPEQMRQPDTLPAFCRVHRNGRPLIGMSERCRRSASRRADRPVRAQALRPDPQLGSRPDRRILAHCRRSALVTNCDPIPGLTPSFGATAPGVQGGKAGAPDCGTVSQCLDGPSCPDTGDGLYRMVYEGVSRGQVARRVSRPHGESRRGGLRVR